MSSPDAAAAPDGVPPEPAVGTIAWVDLTVEDAAAVSAFYASVVGWRVVEHPMAGGYNDYVMADADGGPGAGVCWRRGPNAALPPTWLPYVRVADLDASMSAVEAGGGSLVDGPRTGFAVVRDPAGAHLALFDPHHSSADEVPADGG